MSLARKKSHCREWLLGHTVYYISYESAWCKCYISLGVGKASTLKQICYNLMGCYGYHLHFMS